eukprot:5166015-Pleurochrysis_carterae.AAC.1
MHPKRTGCTLTTYLPVPRPRYDPTASACPREPTTHLRRSMRISSGRVGRMNTPAVPVAQQP